MLILAFIANRIQPCPLKAKKIVTMKFIKCVIDFCILFKKKNTHDVCENLLHSVSICHTLNTVVITPKFVKLSQGKYIIHLYRTRASILNHYHYDIISQRVSEIKKGNLLRTLNYFLYIKFHLFKNVFGM